jgi:hypothetical protein
MTVDITIANEPKRSDAYIKLLGELKQSFVRAGEMVLILYEQGKKDGLPNHIIRKDIEIALDGIVKERRLRELLPLELKRSYTISQDNNNSAIIAELDDADDDSFGKTKHDLVNDIVYHWNLSKNSKKEMKVHMNEALRILLREGKAENIREAIEIFYNDTKHRAKYLRKKYLYDYLDGYNTDLLHGRIPKEVRERLEQGIIKFNEALKQSDSIFNEVVNQARKEGFSNSNLKEILIYYFKDQLGEDAEGILNSELFNDYLLLLDDEQANIAVIKNVQYQAMVLSKIEGGGLSSRND